MSRTMEHIFPKAGRSCHLAIGIGARLPTPRDIAHWMPRRSRARHTMVINGGTIHSRLRLSPVVAIGIHAAGSLPTAMTLFCYIAGFLDAWENRRTQQRGPLVDRILEKGLPVFPRLDTLEVSATVDFYDKLHKTSALFLLPLMLFDAINLNTGFEGLCPPGLGLQQ